MRGRTAQVQLCRTGRARPRADIRVECGTTLGKQLEKKPTAVRGSEGVG